MPSGAVVDAVKRLASRDLTRTEADIQGDIYFLLVSGGLALDTDQVARLEVQTGDGTRRRLDVEIGHAAIEVKRDLRTAGVKRDAERQLAGYVATQSARLNTRYVGILTDGTDWYLYHLGGSELEQVDRLALEPASPNADKLIAWLEAILATQQAIRPTPDEIRRRLGSSSPGYLLDHATIKKLYHRAAQVPEVALKRQLWAKLLRTAFGKSFTDDEELFVDHTLLVLTAEIIAHGVVGFDLSSTDGLTPASLVRGTGFASSNVYGVVEADFFDWILHIDGGEAFVNSLRHRISRFDWAQVEHDVLKVLYESVISADERRSLGEYYTPDWLSERMVGAAINDPLSQRVLDPACGSGTFLFHAVRAYLDAAEDAGVSTGKAVMDVTNHVFGMDVHPVSVTLARVTYLLAIGNERMQADDRGPISVPVYLGDSVQWEQRRDLLGGNEYVRVSTTGDDLVEGGGVLFGDDLIFPRTVLHDAGNFDRLVGAMAERATHVSSKSSKDLITPVLHQFGVHESDKQVLTETFDTMRRLHASGRNHIWGYYVRNLIRPLWLSEDDHRVDVLIGNPPWLRYSCMTSGMQAQYKALGRDLDLLQGGLGASGRDLSTLFVARTISLYLRSGGRFSFVMPHGTLTRKPADVFRSGRWAGIAVAFDDSWDLQNAPTGFPMVSCVIHGTKTINTPRRMPPDVQVWAARLRSPSGSWDAVKERFTITSGSVSPLSSAEMPAPSPYKERFRQGAVLAPRVLLFVERAATGPLGVGAGRVAVRSRRTPSEKKPWKFAPSLEGIVERAFVCGVHLGETLLPYRMLAPLNAVLPVSGSKVLSSDEIEEHRDLATWWARAESQWGELKSTGDPGALLDRIDFRRQLSSQLPPARHRVAYTASGNTLAAARVDEPNVYIEHKLYWAAAGSIAEARYLTAILNSNVVLERVKPLQALGLFGPRDFDKNVFSVPIPAFDPADANHVELVKLAEQAEREALATDISSGRDFKRMRNLVRENLLASGAADAIEKAVARVVPPVELT